MDYRSIVDTLLRINPTISVEFNEGDPNIENICDYLTEVLSSYHRNQQWKQGKIMDLKYGIGSVDLKSYPAVYRSMLRKLCTDLKLPYSY
jgi:hypothetical protein